MTTKFTYLQEDDGKFLVYFKDLPHHWMQGKFLQGLKDHLRKLFEIFFVASLPGIKKVEEGTSKNSASSWERAVRLLRGAFRSEAYPR